jgi:hypothetical protein
MTTHPIRCRCGRIEGTLALPHKGVRAVCYCRDCQSFARFLGPPPGMLDAQGGTEVVVVRPDRVALQRGVDQVACMSLSPRGTLRWFAACCRTPLGNTPRNPGFPHLGLVHSCLGSGGDLAAVFGPVRMRVNRRSAAGAVAAAPALGFAAAIARYATGLALARASGAHRRSPFFDAAGKPIVEPHVIGREERERLRSGTQP